MSYVLCDRFRPIARDRKKTNALIDWGNNSTQQDEWMSLLHCNNARGPKAKEAQSQHPNNGPSVAEL